MTSRRTTTRIEVSGPATAVMRETIRRIGQGIRSASQYLPIRNYAAALATTAAPKDYLGQLERVYKDFLKRWRYVKDPVSIELVTYSPEAVWTLILAGDGRGVGRGLGAGDCDCATVAIGGLLESIGFPIRIATTAPQGAPAGSHFTHVFAQALVPRLGWITVDPVLHPHREFGATTNYSRIAFWNLDGQNVGFSGNIEGKIGSSRLTIDGGQSMYPNLERYNDYGLAGLAGAEEDGPIDWSNVGLKDWGKYTSQMGILNGALLGGMSVELGPNDVDYGGGLVRTPMLELSPEDYRYVSTVGFGYDGMYALGDSGEVYRYDGLSGFFKRMARKVKKAVRKVGKRIKHGIKKVLSRTKFGRLLIKVGAKIHKIAMKIVKPLIKFVGKYAAKLAPIAALIPGFGPAVAAGLYTAGKIANVMRKHMVSLKGKKGTVRGLAMQNPKQLPAFQAELVKLAREQKAKMMGRKGRA